MGKFINGIKKFFCFTHRTGNALLSIGRNTFFEKYAGIAAFGLFLFAGILVQLGIVKYIVLLLLFGSFAIKFIFDTRKFLLSIPGFLVAGSYYWLTISLGVMLCITKFGDIENDVDVIVIGYLVSAIIWCILSLIANNKVANTANQLLSAVLAIFVLSKDAVFALIQYSALDAGQGNVYSDEIEILEVAFNLIVSPILAVNIVAVALCTLKGYWIEKYNNNMDVSEAEPESDRQR